MVMALLPRHPRTRAEEILRARGLTQADFARLAGWQLQMANRIIIGRTGLTSYNRSILARVLDCPESALYQPLGAPIPPPGGMDRLMETFSQRLAALLSVADVGELTGVVQFLATGDYGGLTPEGARRLREALERLRPGGR